MATSLLPRQTVAILGGGITGLSAAYYISNKFGHTVRPVIFESTNRTGGWIKSIKHENNLYEVGPRTIRPANLPGMNTLDLIQELGLDRSINFVPSDHPAAKNRFIYLNGDLVKIATEPQAFLQATPPFKEALLRTMLKEIMVFRKTAPDDTMYNFIARRFGSYNADVLIDPLIRGICGGDAKNISVKFFAPTLYHLEQKYGSLILAGLIPKKWRSELPNNDEQLRGYKLIGSSNLALTAKNEKWSMWTLENGLESLPITLEEKLTERGVEILKNAPVQSIIFDDTTQKNQIEYIDPKTKKPTLQEFSHIISTIPAKQLAKALTQSKTPQPAVAKILDQIPSINMTVTNFKYADPLNQKAFGFLVPSNQKDVEGLLGVVFDTCGFPQENDTILTAMSQGLDFETIEKYMHTTLGYKDPLYVTTNELVNCIPQHTLGHYERLAEVRKIIKDSNLPLILAGASFDGISVNECVMDARRASEQLPFEFK